MVTAPAAMRPRNAQRGGGCRQRRVGRAQPAAATRRVTLRVDDELVHAARAERGADGVGDSLAGVDVGDELATALGRVRALPQEDDLRLHHHGGGWVGSGDRGAARRETRWGTGAAAAAAAAAAAVAERVAAGAREAGGERNPAASSSAVAVLRRRRRPSSCPPPMEANGKASRGTRGALGLAGHFHSRGTSGLAGFGRETRGPGPDDDVARPARRRRRLPGGCC